MGSRERCGALLAVLAAGLVTGCSGGSPAPPTPTPQSGQSGQSALPTTPTAAPILASVWTDSVCAALVPVVARLTAAPPFDLNAPEATREAYLTYLAEGIVVTDRARTALAVLGSAPVTDGDVIAEQVRGDVADLRTDLVDARVQVEQADTGSAVSVGRTLVGVSRVVGALLNSAEVAANLTRDPTLGEAYRQSASCAQLQRSGRPAEAPTPTPTR